MDRPGPVTLSVDVERDWAGSGLRGVREALPCLLEVLDRHQASATFFVVAELVDEVREVLQPHGRHEIGSHGLTHRSLPGLPVAKQAHEVRRSRELLLEAGYIVDGFRAPFYSAPPHLPELLQAAGYRYDASIGRVLPALRPRQEEPVSAGRPVAGVPGSRLTGGQLPASLTSLRVTDPVGRFLLPRRPFGFSLHLHELVDGDAGWVRLPSALRRVHGRRSGRAGWALLHRVLGGRTVMSYRELLGG